MQNYIAQNSINSPFFNGIRILETIKQLFIPKKRVPIKQQLNANTIIRLLEDALNSNKSVTIQINQSLLSEEVENIHGVVYQNNEGQLLVKSLIDHKFTIVLPGTIRHIS